MKEEKDTIAQTSAETSVEANGTGGETQAEFRRKMEALFKELEASDSPKLSLDEIEEYLGRQLGGIAEAFLDGIAARDQTIQPSRD